MVATCNLYMFINCFAKPSHANLIYRNQVYIEINLEIRDFDILFDLTAELNLCCAFIVRTQNQSCKDSLSLILFILEGTNSIFCAAKSI